MKPRTNFSRTDPLKAKDKRHNAQVFPKQNKRSIFHEIFFRDPQKFFTKFQAFISPTKKRSSSQVFRKVSGLLQDKVKKNAVPMAHF